MSIPKESLQAIADLENQRLWRAFAEISAIPRESGNEEGVRNYLLAFAKEHNIESHVDSAGNVIFKAPATAGNENLPPIALQGHMDMVCVKEVGSEHNFLTDPILLQSDGTWLSAKETSLGADNGIAIALILDLLSDPSSEHGPIEAIFTVAEETGLHGAFGLDASLISSRKMINLDGEEEGSFYIGCAGGLGVECTIDLSFDALPSEYSTYKVTVNGLQGGHSGVEIEKQRANAIESVARILDQVRQQIPLRLISFNGGTRRNVIPSHANAVFAIDPKASDLLERIVTETAAELSNEYNIADPHLKVALTSCEERATNALSFEQSNAIITALFLTHHGVYKMSQSMPGLVETSANLAVVHWDEDKAKFAVSCRSSVQSSRDNLAAKIAASFALSGGKVEYEGEYPSWTPNPDSALVKIVSDAWYDFSQQKANVTAIHAGLECGIINSLVKGMDSISTGPVILNAHSTEEKCLIASAERLAKFLRYLLPKMK